MALAITKLIVLVAAAQGATLMSRWGAPEDVAEAWSALIRESAGQDRRGTANLKQSGNLQPPLVALSNLTVKARAIGQFPHVPVFTLNGLGADLQSPVAVGNTLFVADAFGKIYAAEYSAGHLGPPVTVLDGSKHAPDGLLLTFRDSAIINVAAGHRGKSLYVYFRSVNEPLANIPLRRLPSRLEGNLVFGPVPDIYRLGATTWGVLYEYKIIGSCQHTPTHCLQWPRPIAAFELQGTVLTPGGGAMLTVPDGRIALITGDSAPTGFDGRFAPQFEFQTPGKIWLVSPKDGTSQLAGLGIRNSQHMDLGESDGEQAFGFTDIGQTTAEEVNWVPLRVLLNTTTAENFGWGRNTFDSFAREGTFYVSEGLGFGSGGLGAVAVGEAPIPEESFTQPHAQYGRNDPNGGFAVSGPVTSSVSFKKIRCLFGDLARGILYATTESLFATNAQVRRVRLLDDTGSELSAVPELVNLTRADPRFFKLPDGSAAVLLEGNGERAGSVFALTEVRPPP